MNTRCLGLVCWLTVVGCATGDGNHTGDSVDAASTTDASSIPDSSVPDGSVPTDGWQTPVDAGGVDALAGSGLDPDLDPAAPGGAMCMTPGCLTECPLAEVCRFFDTASGRCESCGPCGNLNANCNSSAECDILFMCYQGKCTNFCTLGTIECGPIDDCIDVGHATKGVCRPF